MRKITFDPPFQSINSTGRCTGLSPSFLRKLLKEGKLPGVYCGNRFMVNIPLLLESLNEQGVKA